MEKSKLFITAVALVLAFSAFTTITNNKKYNGTLSAYFQIPDVGWITLFKLLSSVNNAPILATIKASFSNKTAFFCTSSARYRLYKAKTTSNGNTLFTK